MSRLIRTLAGVSLLAIECVANAQTEPSGGLEEIIVTARRRWESLQDVPQTVNAVTSESVEKLNILRFEDVQNVVPGLTLSSGNTGYTTSATIRGASFQVESGARPTVEFYLNDGPIESTFLFQTMYDLGQIEVLRGPQGTLRGRASPSGSITVTSRRANLQEFGGYADVTVNERDRHDGQGALNLPIIHDHLALRLAGLFDENDYNDVKSINNPSDPFERTKSGRATLSWEATDTISGNVTYQYMSHKIHSFDAAESFSLVEPTAPTSNPVITPADRLGITDGARDVLQKMHIVTGNADWRLAGQKLSYVGSYSRQDIYASSFQDEANAIPDFDFFQDLHSHLDQKTHEVRFASEERLFGWMDYIAGAFYSKRTVPNDVQQKTLVGLPLGPAFRVITVANTPIHTGGEQKETSVFANLTAHIGERTEFSGGLRRIDWRDENLLLVSGATLSDTSKHDTPIVYNLSASYHVTDGFMIYANYGKSWREGPNAVGVFRPKTPLLNEFTNLSDETSKSYEVGLKSTFLDQRLRVNASVFHQDFTNYLYRGPLVYYVNLSQTGAAPATFNFVANVDAKVDGAELEVAYAPIERWTVGTTFSYAKGKIKNGLIACNDFNGDGIPDNNPPAPTVAQIRAAAGGEEVAACRVNDRLSTAPDFSGTLQSEYSLPVTHSMDGFIRGLYSYYGSNPQDPHNPYDNVGSYGLLNLYAGVRSNNGAWEVAVFGKNITNTDETLTVRNGPLATNYTNPLTRLGGTLTSLYTGIGLAPQREFGVNVRYAFGSR